MNGEGPVGERGLQATINALSSPVRREILWMLWDAELSAGQIAAGVDLTGGTVSSHLGALRRAGLVSQRVDRTYRYYRVNRPAMEAVLPLLASSDDKWHAADDLPERALADASLQQWVTVNTEVGLDLEAAFAAFADGNRYSQWLGVPVTIEDGRFSTELEWGTRVRGRYEVVAPPQLIAMRWDFDDEVTPVPGRQVVGYLRFFPQDGGCRVEVHQCAADAEQAEFLSAAWQMVLGRFTAYAGSGPQSPRDPRPKHRPTGG
ncbi:MAG TPA: metalloregulator ArsR/SmtB family transcription factor [Nocardioides sp.]|nr:metalloregulator ArsR/SmtB family transcription factor [Nocardioides sp.]